MVRRGLLLAALAAVCVPAAPNANADPLPDCVEGGYGGHGESMPPDLVPPNGAQQCVLHAPDGSSYQAQWSQGATQHQWGLAIQVLDLKGAVQQTVSEEVGWMSTPYGFKSWDLDHDGRPELVVHTGNGAQNGTWAIWRRAAPGASFQRAGQFGAVMTILEEGGFFLALWHMSAFEHGRRLYRFDEANTIVEVAVGDDAISRTDPSDRAVKCDLDKPGDLAAAGLTREQAQERLCRYP